MHYLAPGLELRPTPQKDGLGVYTTQPQPEGTLLVVFGGHVVTGEELMAMPEPEHRFIVQVEADLFLFTPQEDIGPADYVNHSCGANAGLRGQISLVAMRPIEAGEEICMDYVMSDTHPTTDFRCECGSPLCRHHVQPGDWRRPELQRRYAGFFAPHVQRLIDGAETGAPALRSAAVEA